MDLRARLVSVTPPRFVMTLVPVLAISLLATLPQARADSITLYSSGAVTYLDSGTTNGDFPSPFTAGNFTSAQTGTAASVLVATPAYFSSSDIPGAVWIGTNPVAGFVYGDTALYAVSFDLPSNVSSASLSLAYGVDNDLGYSNPGIYINGTALPSSTGIPCVNCTSAFQSVNTYDDASIGSFLTSGTNWIYFDAVNLGDEASFIFSAGITYTATTVTPEPGSLTLLMLGFSIIGVGAVIMKRKDFEAPLIG
jgi:hypothetical protein